MTRPVEEMRRLFVQGLSPLGKKQLTVLITFCWCYISLTLLGILVGGSAALVAQELGMVHTWASRINLTYTLLIFLGALLLLVGYGWVMWRLRRYLLIMITMLYYGVKALALGICGMILFHRLVTCGIALVAAMFVSSIPPTPDWKAGGMQYGCPAWLLVSQEPQGLTYRFRFRPVPFLEHIALALAAAILVVVVAAIIVRLFFNSFGIEDPRKNAVKALVNGWWIPEPSEQKPGPNS